MLVERRKSPIHGEGVFARDLIKKGQWQYMYGEIIPLQDHPMAHYCLEHDDGMYLPYAPFCWTNHSAEPNCDVGWDGDGYIIEALRDIQAGEELTMDYGFTP